MNSAIIYKLMETDLEVLNSSIKEQQIWTDTREKLGEEKLRDKKKSGNQV